MSDQRALHDIEERLRVAIETAQLGTWEVDLSTGALCCSDRFKANFGLPPDVSLTYNALLDLIVPEDRDSVRTAVESAIRMKSDYRAEYRVRWVDGSLHSIVASGRAIYSDSGIAERMSGVTLDVTESRAHKADQARQSEAAEQQLRTLADSIPNLAWMAEPDGFIFWYNRRWYDYTGTTPEQMAGWGWQSVHDPALLPRVLEGWRSSIDTGKPFEMDFPLLGADGQFRWFLTRVHPLKNLSGQVLRWFGTNTNIDQQKRAEIAAEAARREAVRDRERLRSLLEQVPAAISVHRGPEHVVEFVNEFAINNLGGRNPTGLTLREGAPELAAQGFLEILDDVYRNGQPYMAGERKVFLSHPEGTSREAFMNLVFKPWVESDGTIAGVITFSLDVTDQVLARSRMEAAENKLREAARLESIGVLAGGIAHDFNNLLVGIMGNAALALEILPQDAPVRNFLEGVLLASERAADLTRQMLAYSGKGRVEVATIDVAESVLANLRLLSASLPKQVELRVLLPPDLPSIDADVAQFQQVVMNIVINAAEACGKSPGTVTISAQELTVDHDYVTMNNPQLRPGQFVCLQVRDTGCGMDEATLAKIFDPFFTTKFTGRGLGLAAVQGILRGHKGAVEVQSEPGHGSTFRVLFPASSERPKAAKKLPKPRIVGSGKILVIDDEEIVRSTARSSLEHHGYSVVTAENGLEGVEIFARDPNGISLVLLDMSMPVMSGEEAFEALKKIRSDIPIVLSSGFTEMEATQKFSGRGLAGFIQKPYTSVGLAEQIEALLGRA